MGLLKNLKNNFSQSHDDRIKKELQKCKSLDEMFTTLKKYYETDKELSTMMKGIAVNVIQSKIVTVTKALGIKER